MDWNMSKTSVNQSLPPKHMGVPPPPYLNTITLSDCIELSEECDICYVQCHAGTHLANIILYNQCTG